MAGIYDDDFYEGKNHSIQESEKVQCMIYILYIYIIIIIMYYILYVTESDKIAHFFYPVFLHCFLHIY